MGSIAANHYIVQPFKYKIKWNTFRETLWSSHEVSINCDLDKYGAYVQLPMLKTTKKRNGQLLGQKMNCSQIGQQTLTYVINFINDVLSNMNSSAWKELKDAPRFKIKCF